jgi:hypothetical protein
MPWIDVEGDKPSELEALPVGTYKVQCTKSVHNPTSKSSGKPVIDQEYVVIEHPEFNGRKLFHHCSLQENALWKLEETLVALGVDHHKTDLASGRVRISFDPDACVGRMSLAMVSQGINPRSNRPNNSIDKMVRA